MGNEILTSNKNYNKIRDFLRLLFINGCYSKKSLKKYNIITDKQYRDYTNLLLEYFNEENHNIRQYSRDSLQMNFNYYETTENYLIDSYLTKSSSSNYISIYFLVLQILKKNDKPLKRKEITKEIYKVYGFHEQSKRNCFKDLSENSIYKYLKEFVKLGIIEENEQNEFSLKKDIFENLSDDELINLYDAVCFFSNSLVPSTLGYYLKHSIENYFKYIRKVNIHKNELFLHRFTPIHSVLDDKIVIDLLNSIKLKKKIEIEYHKWIFENYCYDAKKFKFKIYPVKIIFDLTLGRWYLVTLDDNNNLSVFRVDRLYNVKNLTENFNYKKAEQYFNENFKNIWTASMPFSKDKATEVKLKINDNRQFILERIIEEGKGGQLTLETDGNYYFTIKVKDEVELLPWIRGLSPHVTIIENANLKKRFVDDIMEMKKNYGFV